jgi:nucleotide-binding universal stress UspA family protein
MAQRGRIVVGVDDSEGATAALTWALEDARRRDAAVEVVHAWTFPNLDLVDYGGTRVPMIAPEDIQKAAESWTRAMVDRAVDPGEGVPLTTTVRRGHPAHVLLDAAQGADLLVVGSRGHGGFAAMLLGSVSSHIVHHATCPVVVVPR